MYDYEGKLMEEDSFSHGIRIISKSYFTADTTTKIFKNGKLIPLNHPN
jgi:trans-2-enoyl-CoA reductase